MSGQQTLTVGGLDLHVPTFGAPAGSVGAFLSDDRRYRYLLWRVWGDTPPALFIGLNPSTADEHVDDRTIGRCVRFARDWGHGGLLMVNLYAWRATKPADLKRTAHPVAEPGQLQDWQLGHANRNDIVLRVAAKHAAITIAAWGGWPGPDTDRPNAIADLVGPLHALGLTAGGEPRHPLYMRADTTPERWS